MKIRHCLLVVFVAVASAFGATRSTPGLPMGDIRVVAPLQLDRVPTVVFMPSPFALRDECEKKGLFGEVLIGFTISAKGKPEKVKVLKSTNQEIAQIVSAFVMKLVFRPAFVSGKPSACEVEIPFVFGISA